MIVFDEKKCIGCGQCVKICHEDCITLVDDKAVINREFCSTCTQCIAICSQQALSWMNVSPIAYEPALLPTPEQLDELFKERRTIRFFKQKKIDRTVLCEIVGYGAYAPTNNFELRNIVVDDEGAIWGLDQIVQQWNRRIYNVLYRPRLVHGLLRRVWPKQDYVQAKPKLEAALEAGRAIQQPAAIVFIVGDKRTPLSLDSAQYALYNMMLYAQVRGIGSRLWGPGRLFLNKSKTAREVLGLAKHERIYGTVLLGYPAVRFRNKVEGKTAAINWVGQ